MDPMGPVPSDLSCCARFYRRRSGRGGRRLAGGVGVETLAAAAGGARSRPPVVAVGRVGVETTAAAAAATVGRCRRLLTRAGGTPAVVEAAEDGLPGGAEGPAEAADDAQATDVAGQVPEEGATEQLLEVERTAGLLQLAEVVGQDRLVQPAGDHVDDTLADDAREGTSDDLRRQRQVHRGGDGEREADVVDLGVEGRHDLAGRTVGGRVVALHRAEHGVEAARDSGVEVLDETLLRRVGDGGERLVVHRSGDDGGRVVGQLEDGVDGRVRERDVRRTCDLMSIGLHRNAFSSLWQGCLAPIH